MSSSSNIRWVGKLACTGPGRYISFRSVFLNLSRAFLYQVVILFEFPPVEFHSGSTGVGRGCTVLRTLFEHWGKCAELLELGEVWE